MIRQLLSDIQDHQFTLEMARDFYINFGFAPKLYVNSFIENGVEVISSLFLYLANPEIDSKNKMNQVTEDPDSQYSLRGVGANFVSLYLTVLFPNECAQWNTPIDASLKLLGMYPKRERGESKGDFYIKINDACKSIMKKYNFKNLPEVDNFLYCLYKGYIPLEKKEISALEKNASIVADDDLLIDEEDIKEPALLEDTHTKIQYLLIKIGIMKNCDVWVAQNDLGKSYNGEAFQNLCLREIPQFTQPQTMTTAKLIDVIWFKKGTANPVRFFEIEHSTSVYSGLLRLNDVRIDFPIRQATIVLPNDRMKRFEQQIERRTFKQSELYDVCEALSYSDLTKW
jgi:type II restriction enzyme